MFMPSSAYRAARAAFAALAPFTALAVATVPAISLAASSVKIEDDFDTAPETWSAHLVTSTTAHIPAPTDPQRDGSAQLLPSITGSGGGGFSGDFLFAKAQCAPSETCTATGCGSQCLNPFWGTVHWGLVHPASYDASLDGTVASIDVTLYAKTWPEQYTESHRIDQAIGVLIRQSDGSGGYRFFRSMQATFVSWDASDPSTGSWQPVSISVEPTDLFYEWNPAGSPAAQVLIDFSEPFEIGVSIGRTATHGQHLTCGLQDMHSWVMTSNVGIDEFSAVIHAVDSDGDTVPDNLDNCTLVPNGPNEAPNDQYDAAGDGYGNACDCDLLPNGAACGYYDTIGFAWCQINQVFPGCEPADMNANGVMDSGDADLFAASKSNGEPGPSGLACAGTVPCP